MQLVNFNSDMVLSLSSFLSKYFAYFRIIVGVKCPISSHCNFSTVEKMEKTCRIFTTVLSIQLTHLSRNPQTSKYQREIEFPLFPLHFQTKNHKDRDLLIHTVPRSSVFNNQNSKNLESQRSLLFTELMFQRGFVWS